MELNNRRSTDKSTPPRWMVTFADLMALLLVFFVLLYSYSTVDEKKYKEITESMEQGFNGIWLSANSLNQRVGPAPGVIQLPFYVQPIPRPNRDSAETEKQSVNALVVKRLLHNLRVEIGKGLVVIKGEGDRISIRFPEEFTFAEGSDVLTRDILPVISHLAKQLEDTEGVIIVAGHTDDLPIFNDQFDSNWALSTARAVAVLHGLLAYSHIDPKRLTAIGHADTLPLVPNDSDANRAKNRRVEIHIAEGIGVTSLSDEFEASSEYPTID